MRLCDSDIIAALNEQRIRIEPRPDDRAISGVSVNTAEADTGGAVLRPSNIRTK